MRKLLPLLSLAVILLFSCTYRSPYAESEIFSAMGGNGELVVTVNLDKARNAGFSSLLPDSEIIDRSDRISISIADDIYGVAEGNFGYTLVNAFFNWSSDWKRVGEDPVYYRGRTMDFEAAVAKSGILLFSSSSYEEAYSSLIDNRRTAIDAETATLMASSIIAAYTTDAEKIVPFDMGITADVADNIERLVFLFDGMDGKLYLSAWIDMDTSSSARALATFFRNELLKSVRERGERPDYALLSSMCVQDGNTVRLSGMEVSLDLDSLLSHLEVF